MRAAAAVVSLFVVACSSAGGDDAGVDAPGDLAADAPLDAGTDFGVDASCSADAGDAGPVVDCAPACVHGSCDTHFGVCTCALGWAGDACDACALGFVAGASGCAPLDDRPFDTWPNASSRTNGDPWLVVHHDEIRTMRPSILVLNFVDPSDPAAVDALLAQIVAAFAEGSRARGYEDATTAPQLELQLLPTRDLRDGQAGHPPAPAGWPWENSTLYPRRAPGTPGTWGLDYAQLFSPAFAPYLGFTDGDGSHPDLCTLVERGDVHELWLVGSGDVPGDASAAEVLEWKPHYDSSGNRRDDGGDRCAGNGCFDPDVPHCARSLRIGFVNYTRGPGCYLHSYGHAIESAASHGDVPSWRAWFLPFARFDLRDRYALPADSLYDVRCPTPPCIAYPMPDHARFTIGATTYDVPGWDGACGNVHFPPNALADYDSAGVVRVASSCDDFGRTGGEPCGPEPAPSATLNSSAWSRYGALAPDCSGDFLVWWYQHMPGYASGHAFRDGTPMKSVWPFLYY